MERGSLRYRRAIFGAHQFEDIAAEQLRFRSRAEKGHRAGVHIEYAPVATRQDSFRRAFYHRAEAFFAVAQRFFRALALRDVFHHSHKVQRLSGAGPKRRHCYLGPHRRTIFADVAFVVLLGAFLAGRQTQLSAAVLPPSSGWVMS